MSGQGEELHPERPLLGGDTAENLEAMKRSGALGYRSETMPIWCPGCGYFGITHAVNHALSALKIPNRNLAVVSGIGCAGRYPFFSRCYGFHVVHGRTIPVASGIKMANPALSVIALAGDGDSLAIGGGHLPHGIRRNVDITYILFDNGIYGLTKGQSSPTTPQGQVTGTHPYGNPDIPLNPTLLALAYGASFVAKGYAGEPGSLREIFAEAMGHRGFSFVHVVSACVTFDHENILYERLRTLWEPVPEDHDPADRGAAITLAMERQWCRGVYFVEQRKAWDELQAETAARAAVRRTDSAKK